MRRVREYRLVERIRGGSRLDGQCEEIDQFIRSGPKYVRTQDSIGPLFNQNLEA